jgi:hypothetical protein
MVHVCNPGCSGVGVQEDPGFRALKKKKRQETLFEKNKAELKPQYYQTNKQKATVEELSVATFTLRAEHIACSCRLARHQKSLISLH